MVHNKVTKNLTEKKVFQKFHNYEYINITKNADLESDLWACIFFLFFSFVCVLDSQAYFTFTSINLAEAFIFVLLYWFYFIRLFCF